MTIPDVLLTGELELDERIQLAYDAGARAGRTEGRQIERINATKEHLNLLMRSTGISLEDAMAMLRLPKKERKCYRKIFEKRKK